jgi:hypothetical protein
MSSQIQINLIPSTVTGRAIIINNNGLLLLLLRKRFVPGERRRRTLWLIERRSLNIGFFFRPTHFFIFFLKITKGLP